MYYAIEYDWNHCWLPCKIINRLKGVFKRTHTHTDTHITLRLKEKKWRRGAGGGGDGGII